MSDDNQEGAMLELIPADSEARHASMTRDQESHLIAVQTFTRTMIDRKYRAGQRQHGGDLWLKPGMLAHAFDEVVDQVTYLQACREQCQAMALRLREGRATVTEAADFLDRLWTP